MNTGKKINTIDLISAILLFIFLYTALSKLFFIAPLINTIQQTPFINYAKIIAWAIPVAEIITASLLFFRSTRSAGLISSVLILVVFTSYIAAMILSRPKEKLPCTCGGVIEKLSWNQHLLLNIILLFIAAFAAARINIHKSLYYNKQEEAEILRKKVSDY